MFRYTPVDRLAQNFLVISIQPDECIGLQFTAKVPGPVIAISGVGMTFKYQDYFDAAPSTGYETLIYDCMIGDAILFQRADGVEAEEGSNSEMSWQIIPLKGRKISRDSRILAFSAQPGSSISDIVVKSPG